MSANEISERVAAVCWLELGPQSGEDLAFLDGARIRLRSSVGFSDRILTSVDVEEFPLIILRLDEEKSRRSNQVLAYCVSTVDEEGVNYPQTVLGNRPLQVSVQPFHTDWMGDPTAPAWLPFSATAVPDAANRNLDVFNAIALQLMGETPGEGDFQAYAGDFCVLVLKAPMQEGTSRLVPAIPAPEPPVLSKLYRYFGPDALGNEGGVYEWPDSGDAPLVSMTQPTLANRPGGGVSELLNGLAVVKQSAGAPEVPYMEAPIDNGDAPNAFSLALMCATGDEGLSGGRMAPAWVYDNDGVPVIGVAWTDDEVAAGWYVLNADDEDDEFIGAGARLALVFSVAVDGSWEATYSLDWAAQQTLSGTVANAVLNGLEVFGVLGGAPTGQLQDGEVRVWSHRALSSGERDAVLQEFRDVWQPLRRVYFGPSNAPGLVASWPDSAPGQYPLVDATAYEDAEPTAAVGLNGLVVVTTADGSQGCFAPGSTRGLPFSFAFVADKTLPGAGGGANAIGFWNPDNGNEASLYWGGWVFSGGPFSGWGFVVTEAGAQTVAALAANSVQVFAGVVSVQPTGEYEITFSADWAADAAASGSGLPDFGVLTQIFLMGSGEDESSLCESRWWSGFLDSGQRSAVLAELRATWEPPPSSVVVRLRTINAGNLSEGGDGTAGWTYTWVFGDLTAAYAGNSDFYLPSGVAGSFRMTFVAGAGASAAGGPALLLLTSTAITDYASAKVAVFQWNADANFYSVWRDGVQVAADHVVASANGDIVRVTRTGATMVIEVSKDSGGSWLPLVTWLDGWTGDLFCGCDTDGASASTMGLFTGTGLSPSP